MKLKVRLTFQDKETKKIYKPGQIIDIADSARVQDMLNRKLCESVDITKKTGEGTSAKDKGNGSKKGNPKSQQPAKVEVPAKEADPAPVEGAGADTGEKDPAEQTDNQE